MKHLRLVGSTFVLAIAECLGACAGRGGGAASPKGEGELPVMLVEPAASSDGDQVFAAWLGYGLGKMAAYQEHPPPASNESGDDYALELAGREAQSAIWSDLRQKGAPAFPLLDQQVKVWRAGFLPELVISVHGRPGWTIPGPVLDKLRLPAFAEKFPGKYTPGAPVAINPRGGKPFANAPGLDFPNPAELPPGKASCTRNLTQRKAAWSRFTKLEALMGGEPVSADTTIDFERQLIAAQGEKIYKARGVTWVSPRVGYLAMLDGYCAVERKDWPEALRALGRAVSLRPADAQPRLELVLALTASRRYDEALAQITRVMELTKESKDGCVVAFAWRRLGFLFFEKGALSAAQTAYQTSLKYDPQSPIARVELETIAELLKQRRPGAPEPPAPPMPWSQMTVTACGGGPASEQ